MLTVYSIAWSRRLQLLFIRFNCLGEGINKHMDSAKRMLGFSLNYNDILAYVKLTLGDK